tara:strand:- start:1005 stop:1574 length:570 start_codon:yes stop_codon:yes gene_type:complete
MECTIESDDAEVGTSAMVMFIALILVSSIISGLIVGVGENVFSHTKTGAQQNIPTLNGITNVVILEVFSLGANDAIHIVFELPYVDSPVPDVNLGWALLCTKAPTGAKDIMHLDSGNFELATTLDGDGLTALPLLEFEPGVDYRMIMQLSNCDLDGVDEATLVLMVERGRTQEYHFSLGGAAYLGQDLN